MLAEASLGGLQLLLEELAPHDSEGRINENLSLIRKIGAPNYVLAVVHQVLEDQRILADVANRSYRHVNHFDKIVLVDSGREQKYRLTLHLWSPPYTEAEVSDELIHDHRFSFWSTVLTGELVSENYLESPPEAQSATGTVFRQYTYSPEKSARMSVSNFYEFLGETTLVRTGVSTKTAGESYHLSNERIHQVLLPHDRMTCTLVLRGPRLRSHSRVFNRSYPTQNTRMTNTMFSAAQLAEKLSRLVAAIQQTRLPSVEQLAER